MRSVWPKSKCFEANESKEEILDCTLKVSEKNQRALVPQAPSSPVGEPPCTECKYRKTNKQMKKHWINKTDLVRFERVHIQAPQNHRKLHNFAEWFSFRVLVIQYLAVWECPSLQTLRWLHIPHMPSWMGNMHACQTVDWENLKKQEAKKDCKFYLLHYACKVGKK